MGLDITAYYGLKLAVDQNDDDETGLKFYVNEDFKGREGSIIGDTVYNYEECGDILSRSYGTYNHWRDELAQAAGWESAKDACFSQGGVLWELINFSNCEGVIGPEICKKLAADFANITRDTEHLEPYFSKMKAAVSRCALENGALKFS